MESKIKYFFSAKIWKYNSPNGWHFVSLPKDISIEIRTNLKWQEEGWGRMSIVVEVEEFEWKTAIWFDTKMDTYVLPIRAEIRKKLHLENNQTIEMSVWV